MQRSGSSIATCIRSRCSQLACSSAALSWSNMHSDRRRYTTVLLLLGPAALLGGALGFQYIGGLPPCEMCMWQRWALVTALVVALAGWAAGGARAVLALAALVVLAGAGIAAFHAGVEQHWWQGFTECTAAPVSGSASDIMGRFSPSHSSAATPYHGRFSAFPWQGGTR